MRYSDYLLEHRRQVQIAAIVIALCVAAGLSLAQHGIRLTKSYNISQTAAAASVDSPIQLPTVPTAPISAPTNARGAVVQGGNTSVSQNSSTVSVNSTGNCSINTSGDIGARQISSSGGSYHFSSSSSSSSSSNTSISVNCTSP